VVNDRKKNQDETENENKKKTMGGENRPGQAKQTQGEASRGKQFEGGREGSGSSSEPKTARTGGKPKGKSDTESSTDDDQQ
jgi:hypothetical protein